MRETTKRDGDLVVTARWGQQSDGPAEVSIRFAESASAKVARRGVTTGVMRRVEWMLADMAAELEPQPTPEVDRVLEMARVLPRSPRRDAASYYGGLLEMFSVLDGAGHSSPINVLAEALGLPKGTVKTQLAAARRLANRRAA